jgi:UDP-glucuronate decarboxylase
MTENYPSGKKNILILGGAGFIGSHLCDRLVQDNHVVCVDNFITSSPQNIDHLLTNPNFEFIKHDITRAFDIEEYPELKKFDVSIQGFQEIYNLACPTSPKEYNKIPIETLITNSLGSFNALEIAKKFNAKFLHLSTSAIYGDLSDVDYVREDNFGNVNPVGPRSCYNEGKRFAESLVINYHGKEGLDTKIARIFNTFGPRMKIDDGRMIPDFVASALLKKDIVIYGSETEIGSYCYIDDTLDALVALMASDYNGPVNVGSDQAISIADMAKKIINIVGSDSKIEFTEHLPYTAKQIIPNVALAKSIIGWFPMVSLDVGLEKTIHDMKININEYQVKLS